MQVLDREELQLFEIHDIRIEFGGCIEYRFRDQRVSTRLKALIKEEAVIPDF